MTENPVAEIGALDGIIDLLLFDQNTGDNIIWADVNRSNPTAPIETCDVFLIEPRFMKERERQSKRTRERAEVFTPPDICRLQNNLILKHWLDQPLEQFIDAKFLEIACGEAPYIVSRYNVVDGTPIAPEDRVGLLDRKLQSLNRHVDSQSRWIELARRSFQSVYGYEFQGDNLLIARCNLFLTAEEFYCQKFRAELPYNFLLELTEIITWNFFQYDGINHCRPFDEHGTGLFNECLIKNWSTGETVSFP